MKPASPPVDTWPLPFRAGNCTAGRVFKSWRIFDANKGLVCTVNNQRNGDREVNTALYIERACNSFPALVELLERYVESDRGIADDLTREARAALAAAQKGIDR